MGTVLACGFFAVPFAALALAVRTRAPARVLNLAVLEAAVTPARHGRF